MRVVGKAIWFDGQANEVLVQFSIAIHIVENADRIVAGRHAIDTASRRTVDLYWSNHGTERMLGQKCFGSIMEPDHEIPFGNRNTLDAN